MLKRVLAPIETEWAALDMRAYTLVTLQLKWLLKPSDILNKRTSNYIDNVSQNSRLSIFFLTFAQRFACVMTGKRKDRQAARFNRHFALMHSRLSTQCIAYICEASCCGSSEVLLLHRPWHHRLVMAWSGDVDPLILNLLAPELFFFNFSTPCI